jgi:hypothetical protein
MEESARHLRDHIMTAQAVLKKLEPMTDAARMRHMVELGKKARNDAGTAAILRDLEQGQFYERIMALQSRFGSGVGSHPLRALHDPSRMIQRRALKLIALFADDRQVKECRSFYKNIEVAAGRGYPGTSRHGPAFLK